MILGLKRKRRTGLDSKDIPGFAKWISAEVYVDDKIAEGCIESLALKMVGYSDWINDAMKDICEGDGNLLESPVKDKSPMRELRQREVEVIRETTSLMTDKTGDGETDFNDSFELISRDIRRSYAAKQRESIKTAEDEIKELSKLIDGDAGLFSDDEDVESGAVFAADEDVDVFDKIEVAQVHKIKAVSPIKFSEMPRIEPLTLRKKKKKVIEKVVEKVAEREKRADDVSKREENVLKLNPLPNTFFTRAGDTSFDEPTIKVKRVRPAAMTLTPLSDAQTPNKSVRTTATVTSTTAITTTATTTTTTTTPGNTTGNIPLAKRRLKSDAGSEFASTVAGTTAATTASTTTTPLLHTLSLAHKSPRKSQRPSRLPLRVSHGLSSPVKLPWTHPARLKAQLRRQTHGTIDPTTVFGPVPPLPDL